MNSSAEMKKVKTRLEKKREMDGIDHSNIVEEPRRSREPANSWFTPRPNRYAQVVDKNAAHQGSPGPFARISAVHPLSLILLDWQMLTPILLAKLAFVPLVVARTRNKCLPGP